MKEEILHTSEHTQSPETGSEKAEHVEIYHTTEKPLKQAEKPSDGSIERIRASIKQEALTANDELLLGEHNEPVSSLSAIGRDLKNQALFRTLKNLRRHLSPSERGLSRVIHQPVLDTVSEFSGKTVARPSGMLGGGICAFLGSLVFLYLAKHIGFRYNYLLFLYFFIGGFVIGLVLEISILLTYRLKQRS